MAGVLELAVLDADAPSQAVAVGRCGDDVAVIRMPCGAELKTLESFRARIHNSLLGVGTEARPDENELKDFGDRLHKFLMKDDLGSLFKNLSADGRVRINFISNHASLRSVPWEYMLDLSKADKPMRERTIARIVPTIGVPAPVPLPLQQKVRILFACAEPQDQEPVSWPEMQESITRPLKRRLSDRFELTVVEAADQASLASAVAKADYDIFHFSGHGEVVNGVGHLVLINRNNNKSSRISASTLAGLLGGKRFRLAVLSACETAAGGISCN